MIIQNWVTLLLAGTLGLSALVGCASGQEKPAQGPSAGLGTGVQVSPWVDASCFAEGHLVPLQCNALGAYPACPAEDSPYHAGEPCFWIDPNGKGLLWSDGIPSASEK